MAERDLAGVSFVYQDPCSGFDRKLVKGLVAELLNISTENEHMCTALEVCAGGKLYNVRLILSFH